jgi:hypothetical protein
VNEIAGLMFTILMNYIEIIKTVPGAVLSLLKVQYNDKIRERFKLLWGFKILNNLKKKKKYGARAFLGMRSKRQI